MDFDKLKKAAANTIKAVSNKIEDFSSDSDKAEEPPKMSEIKDDVIDDFSELFPSEDNDDADSGDAAQTQRFNLQDMLERFRQRKDDFDGTFRNIIGGTHESSSDDASAAENTENDNNVPNPQPADEAIDTNAINESISELSEKLSELNELNEKGATDTAEISSRLDEISEQIAAINKQLKEDGSHVRKAVDNLNGNFNTADKKLSDITNSLASISKLNDSIFDLKNAQMNTKNSLGDLEASFYKLKKKMSTSVLIISILTALIVIMEIINLLS